MNLAEILNLPPIFGAFCATVDPDIWWDDRRAGLARHLCLSHCEVRRECLATAATWAGAGCVAAGFQWVTDKSAEGRVRIKTAQELPVRCHECVYPGAEVQPPRVTSRAETPQPVDRPRKRSPKATGDAFTAEIRRLAALAAS